MYITVLAPLATFVAVALAASNPNPFNVPEGFALTAGEPTTLRWTPTTSGTVTLRLREGSSNNLDEGTVIEASIPNSGSYTYTPPADTVRNSDYTIEITSDSDPSQANYTPYFVMESSNTVASVSADSASASGTPSPSASDSSATVSTATDSTTGSSAAATTMSTAAMSTDSSSASITRSSSSASGSTDSSESSTSATRSTSSTRTSSSPTPSSTGEETAAAGSSIPSSGAMLTAVGQLNVQTGLLAILLSAVAAW